MSDRRVADTSMSVSELAARLERPFSGDGDVAVDGVASLESAGPGDLGYVRSSAFASRARASAAAALVAPPDIDVGDRPVIRSEQPGFDFVRATRLLHPSAAVVAGIASSASVAPDASVDPTASIGPGCAIGARARVGAHTLLHANVTVYDDAEIGADCVIHSGCVLREATRVGARVLLQPGVMLGGDGFAYVAGVGGTIEKVPQMGRVVVDDDVEIGANTTVDRGALGDTRIRRGAKIDNLVQIGHGCDVGEDVLIIAQAGLSGSTVVEKGAIVMAQAGVVGHLTIGERAVVGPQCGVHKDVPARVRVLGSPQREGRLQQKIVAALPRLPDLLRRVRAIEKRLAPGGGGDGNG